MQGPVLQGFSYDEAHPYAAGQHRGIDIGADAEGETVVAPAAGTVSFAGTVPTNGKSVTIETADGYSVTLTHLGSIGVTKGASVSEGGDGRNYRPKRHARGRRAVRPPWSSSHDRCERLPRPARASAAAPDRKHYRDRRGRIAAELWRWFLDRVRKCVERDTAGAACDPTSELPACRPTRVEHPDRHDHTCPDA